MIKRHKKTDYGCELNPEYLGRLQKIRKGKYFKFNSIDELRNKIEKGK
ncbi:hypothetical protein J4463_04625 [Candidatus Pacearchaeota archaeon]|nr:hypothetical protein [Candidatus Pacearchaeota archaeon]